MTKYIKFKVKDLFKVLGIFLLIAMLGYLFLPSALLAMGKNYHSKGEVEVAKIFYDRLDKYFPHSGLAAEALERAAQLSSSHNMLEISPMGIGGANWIGGSLSKEEKYYYSELASRFPNSFQGRRAINNLRIQEIKDHIYLDNIDQGLRLTEEYYDNQTAPWGSDTNVAMEAARVLQSKGYYQEGIIVVNYALEGNRDVTYPDLYELLGDLYGALGNVEKAKFNYQQVLKNHEEMLEWEREFADKNHLEGTKQYIREKKGEIENKIAQLSREPIKTGSVMGTITLSGEPLTDAHIFLQPQNQPNVYHSNGGRDAIWGMSNKQGDFIFESVTPGRYGLGFVLDLDQVGDVVLEGGPFPNSIIYVEEGGTHTWAFSLVETMKVLSPVDEVVIEGDFVDFAWASFEGAAYYTLELGAYSENSSFSSPFPTKYVENKARLSIEEIHTIRTGMSYDEKGPMALSLLGYGTPGGKYFWGVRAHDENGEILTVSRGYLKKQNTDFTFPEGKMSEGDKLLIERKYGEAIEAYERILEDDPNNVRTLKILAAIYEVDIRSDISDYPYSDFEKAIVYYQRLYAITGNARYLDSIADIYYYSLKDYEKAFITLKQIAEQEPLNDWQLMMVARIEGHFGNFTEGLKALLKAGQRYHQEEAALRIITGNFDLVVKREEKEQQDLRWQKAMEKYIDHYKSSERKNRETIKNMTALEGLAFLQEQKLTPVGQLLELSLKVIEPSLRNEADNLIEEFIKSHGSSNPELAQIVRGLYQ